MIQVKGLTKVYGRNNNPAIDAVSFDVRNGEIVGFVGLNGAGKTTTIRIASGVSLPSRGSVLVDGHDVVNDKVAACKGLGWVPEFPNFEPNAKARSTLIYYAGFYNIPKEDAEKRTDELLHAVSLDGFATKKLRTYSQGMKKRFSLAASMISDPQNYLFDEILNGLDPEGIHFMRSLTVDLRSKGKAVLLSSHILSEIQNIADRIVFIHRGKIIKVATRDELSSVAGVGGVLRVVISNIGKQALDYLKTLGEVRVVAQDTALVSNFTGDSALVNAELVKRGFVVREINYQAPVLEDYFFKLIQGQN